MEWQITPYTIALLLSATATAAVAVAVWYRRTARGGRPLFWFTLAMIEWQLTGACEAAAVGIPAKILWSKICYVGTLSSPVLLATFAFQYSLRDKWLTRRNLALLWVVPVMSFGLAVTNEWHHLIWTSFTPSPDPASNVLIYGHGTWFWIMVAYFYLLLCAATAALILAALRYRHLYRRQVAMLLLAIPFPWMGNILYVFKWGPFPGQDLTPISFALAGVLLTANLYALRFLDLVPMARDAVIETMKDSVLVLDAQGRIADINPAARQLLEPDAPCVGRDIAEVLAAWPELADHGCTAEPSPVEIPLDGRSPRYVEVQVSNLYDQHRAITGRVIVLRDITERARAEADIARASDALRESEKHFRSLFETMAEGVVSVAPNGQIIQANPTAERILGLKCADIQGRNYMGPGWKVLRLDGTPMPPEEMAGSRAMRERRLVKGVEMGIQHLDGSIAWINVSAAPLVDEAGELVEVVGTFTDITERVRAEEELRKHREHLEELVEERTSELRQEITERKRAEENLRRRNLELELLYQTSKQVASSLELEQVVADLLEAVRRLLRAKACSLWLVDPQTDDLVCQKAVGPDSGQVTGWRLPSGQGVAGWVFDRGRSLIVPDARAEPHHHKGIGEAIGWEIRSLLAVPLGIKHGPIGVIEVIDEQADQFTDDSLRVLESLATTAAIALENARLYDQTRRDAETNALLLREVNHRVKNNLAAMMGMLHIERRHAEKSPDRRTYQAAIDDLLERIKGLAAVHELLSASMWSPLPLSKLVRKVINTALQALPADKRVLTEISATTPVEATPQQAHNLAIVTNELATNVVKYAARPDQTVQLSVHIALEPDGETIRLEFRDDGPGFPEKVLRSEYQSAGLYLVQNTVRRNLRGEIGLHNDDGAVITIHFPKAVE
jgi:PAS domain S-box-containing protein